MVHVHKSREAQVAEAIINLPTRLCNAGSMHNLCAMNGSWKVGRVR